MSNRRTARAKGAAHAAAPGLRARAVVLAAAMSAAREPGQAAELRHLMLVVAADPRLSQMVWRVLADELSAESAGTGTEG